MGGSSSRTVTDTDQTTNNEYNTIGQEVSDGIGILGDGNSVVMTDHGAMDMGMEAFNRAVGITTTSQNMIADAVNETLRSNEANTAEAFNFGRDSLGAVERAAAEQQVGALDMAQMVKENSEYAAEVAAGAAQAATEATARNATQAMLQTGQTASEAMGYTMDAAQMVDATAREAMNEGIDAALTGAGMGLDTANNALLSMENTSQSAIASNTELSQQYADNLYSISENNADRVQQAAFYGLDTANNALLTSGAATDSALSLAERLSTQYGDNLYSISENNADRVQQAAMVGMDTAKEAILSNTDTTQAALQSNNQLASNFGELLTGFATDNQAISEAQASQYAQNLFAMGQQLGDVSAQSIDAQNQLAGNALMTIESAAADSIAAQQSTSNAALSTVENVANSSLMFADQQNQYLAQTLGDNASITQTALMNLAERQERGLDAALQVAGSVAMDDNAEAATNQTKYLALAIAAGAVAFAMRG